MLQITLVHAERPGDTREVEVDARGDDTVDALGDALRRTVGEAWGGHLHLRGRPIAGPTTLDQAGLLDGAVLTVAGSPLPGARPSTATAPLAVAVVGGPDAGHRVELRPGTVRIGRSPEADVVVDDPELSRVHAVLEVGPDVVWLRDCGSTNGTLVDGRRVPLEGCAVDTTSLVTLGSTRLRLRPTAARPAAVGPATDGVRLVNRAPRIRRDAEPPALTLPAAPNAPARAGLPWAALLLPLPVGIVLALVFSPVMLLVSLMSPLLVAGTALTDRVTGRRRYAAQLATHRDAVRAVETAAAEAVAVEERRRRRALPDPAEVLSIATTPSSRLWERGVGDVDALHVGLGTWTTPSGVRLDDPAGPARHRDCREVPCALPLAEVGVLGVGGPSGAARALARSLVGQLVALRSPRDLRVVVVTADAEAAASWAWVTRLPHAPGRGSASPCGGARRGVLTATEPDALAAGTRMLLDEAEAQGASAAGARHTVVVVDGAERLRRFPGVAELLARGSAGGVVVVALDTHGDRLPPECGAVLELGPGAGRLRSRVGPGGTDLVPDGVGPWWGERLSRALAPLRDATPGVGEGLPSTVRLLDLLPEDTLDPAALARRWAKDPRSTRAVLGVGADGPHHVDLLTDGPHLLVGGTTGSGKSELLQTLIASLAVANRPDQLAFLLLDYKGGAAFADGARLPHTLGLVTDLDDGLAQRALVSLTAELKRRERCLAEAGVADLAAYLPLADAGLAPPLPRLVIVIDEFRVLADELPEFLRGLVRVAAVGRSLGVHLVLATQRPAGVVSADIKANVNLRIALRMRDRSDSEDVIEAPDAARLDETCPGRALARDGTGGLDQVQVARVGGRPPAARRGPTVAVLDGPRPVPSVDLPNVDLQTVDLPSGDLPSGDQPARTPALVASGAEAEAGTDLSRLVGVLREAVDLDGTPLPARPWLPALPESLPASGLAGDHPGLGPRELPLGLADLPHAQAQEPLVWCLERPEHWAAVGGTGSGRTTLARLVATTAAARLSPRELHLYAVQAGGPLRDLAALPHTGAVAAHDDLPRVARLVRRLTHEVARRQRVMAEHGWGSLAEWRAASDGPTPPALLLLVVDGWESLTAAAEAVDHGELVDQLLGLLRDGASAGLRGLVTGGRELLRGRVSTLAARRLVLRLDDPADALLAGLPSPAGSGAARPAGRCVLAPSGTEVQLALPDLPCKGGAPAPDLLTVPALPAAVPASSLPREAGADATVWLGVGGDAAAPVGLDPVGDGRLWLVAGPPRSGRSTALRTVADDLLARGREVAVVGGGPGPLAALRADPRVCWVAADDTDLLVAARRRAPGLAVLVDDADALLDSRVEPVLREVARLAERDGGLLVCATATSSLAAQYRGLAVEVARRRTGLLLGPLGAADGDLLGVRLPRHRGAGAGRGLLVRHGEVAEVQVAHVQGAQGQAAQVQAAQVQGAQGQAAQVQAAQEQVPATPGSPGAMPAA